MSISAGVADIPATSTLLVGFNLDRETATITNLKNSGVTVYLGLGAPAVVGVNPVEPGQTVIVDGQQGEREIYAIGDSGVTKDAAAGKGISWQEGV